LGERRPLSRAVGIGCTSGRKRKRADLKPFGVEAPASCEAGGDPVPAMGRVHPLSDEHVRAPAVAGVCRGRHLVEQVDFLLCGRKPPVDQGLVAFGGAKGSKLPQRPLFDASGCHVPGGDLRQFGHNESAMRTADQVTRGAPANDSGLCNVLPHAWVAGLPRRGLGRARERRGRSGRCRRLVV
jgi:hypothetical protein